MEIGREIVFEVFQRYLSDDLAADSDNENQLLRARRGAASNKKATREC